MLKGNKVRCDESVLRSAKACHYAFQPLRIAKTYPHLDHVKRIENHDTGISLDVWKSGKFSSVISFRGSASVQNLWTYAMNSHEEFSFRDAKFNIHKGVYTMFNSVHDEILQNIPMKHHSLTFTGYSLGGAMAMYAASYVSLMTPRNIVQCHTFGAPLVGDKEFMTTFQDRVPWSLHVVNQFDIVPHLLQNPFPSFKYTRVPKENVLYIKSKNPLKFMFRPLQSHDVLTYIENIEHHLQEQRL